MGARLPRPLGARQGRALDARRELHGILQLEDLRQGRRRDLGDAADRLPAHAARHAQPRAARLCPRCVLLVVPVQRQPRQAPAGPRPADPAVARGAQDARRRSRPGHRSSTIPRSRAPTSPCAASAASCAPPGTRSTRSSRRPTSTPSRSTARPHHRLLADPGDVDGELRRRQPLPQPDRRRLHEFLRLVLRPPAVEPAGVGRADRRAGIRRLVQLVLPDRVGLERPADAHAGRALLHRGPLQGREGRRRHARLFGSREARRSLDASEAGHRRRARDGDGPRDPAGVPPRPPGGVLRGLLPPLHRHAAAREARAA